MTKVRSTEYAPLTNIDTDASTLYATVTGSMSSSQTFENLPTANLYLVPEEGYTITAIDCEFMSDTSSPSLSNATITFHDCVNDFGYLGSPLEVCDDATGDWVGLEDGPVPTVEYLENIIPGAVGNHVKVKIAFSDNITLAQGFNLDIDIAATANIVEEEVEDVEEEICVSAPNAHCDYAVMHNIHQRKTMLDGYDWKRINWRFDALGESTIHNHAGIRDNWHSGAAWTGTAYEGIGPYLYSNHDVQGDYVSNEGFMITMTLLQVVQENYNPATTTAHFTTNPTPTVRTGVTSLPNPTNHGDISAWIWEWNIEQLESYTPEQCDAMADVVMEVWEHLAGVNSIDPYISGNRIHLLGLIPSFGTEGVQMTTSNFTDIISLEQWDDSPEALSALDGVGVGLEASSIYRNKFHNYIGGEGGVHSDFENDADDDVNPGWNRFTDSGIDLLTLLGGLTRAVKIGFQLKRPTECLNTEGTTIGLTNIAPEWNHSGNDNYTWFWDYIHQVGGEANDDEQPDILITPHEGYDNTGMLDFSPPPQFTFKVLLQEDKVFWRGITIDQLWAASCGFRANYSGLAAFSCEDEGSGE